MQVYIQSLNIEHDGGFRRFAKVDGVLFSSPVERGLIEPHHCRLSRSHRKTHDLQ